MPHVTGRRLTTLLGRPDATGPSYLWLADGIRALAADGRLLHGTRLPSEREMVAAVGLSRTTVTRAYAVLVDRGYALARRGSGTVVQLPGGPVAGGGEPLAEWDQDGETAGLIDLRRAAPAAPPGLRDAVESATERLTAYLGGAGYFPLGIPELRAAIARRYTERGALTDPDQIVVTCGALAALSVVTRALLPRGSRVVIETPTYTHFLAALEGSGARLTPVPISPMQPDIEARNRALSAGATGMLAMPDFHNPTGLWLDDAARAELAGRWQRHNVLGIVDETLAETRLDEGPHALAMAAHSRDCVSIGSASKTYWGGLRIGWIRVPRPLIGAIASTRLSLDLGAPVLEQLIATELIRASGTVHPAQTDERREGRAALLSLRVHLPQWQVHSPTGGLCLWWRLPAPSATRFAARARQHGVLLDPGAVQAVQGQGMEHHVRMPFTLPAATLRDVVPVLAQAWNEVMSEPRSAPVRVGP
ncbi:MAG: PLP-dependent aminotransferase family protein [Allobranchiibius sp.]